MSNKDFDTQTYNIIKVSLMELSMECTRPPNSILTV